MHLKLRYHSGCIEQIHGFTDADWAADADERRSVSGFLIKMNGAAISWGAKRQPIVALSSTEAEYIALSSLVCEMIWLMQLANEIGHQMLTPIKLYCDNESTINLAKCDGYRPRTKHIDTRYHYIRQYVDRQLLKVEHVSTNVMSADSLTKVVSKEKHQFCAEQAGLI